MVDDDQDYEGGNGVDTRSWKRIAFEALLADPDLSSRQRRVAYVLIKYMDDDGLAFPSERRLALDCGMDRRDTRKVLNELCVDDERRISPDALFVRFPGERGRGRPACYKIVMSWFQDADDARTRRQLLPVLPEKKAAPKRPFSAKEKGANPEIKGGISHHKRRLFASEKAAPERPESLLNPLLTLKESIYAQSDDCARHTISPAILSEMIRDLELDARIERYNRADMLDGARMIPALRARIVPWLRQRGLSKQRAQLAANVFFVRMLEMRRLWCAVTPNETDNETALH